MIRSVIGAKRLLSRTDQSCQASAEKTVIMRLSEATPCESYRPDYAQDRQSNALRQQIDPLILIQLLNLSDEVVNFQVNERRSYEEFVDLGVMSIIPDTTTQAFFRESAKCEDDRGAFGDIRGLPAFASAASPRWPTQYSRGEGTSKTGCLPNGLIKIRVACSKRS